MLVINIINSLLYADLLLYTIHTYMYTNISPEYQVHLHISTRVRIMTDSIISILNDAKLL